MNPSPLYFDNAATTYPKPQSVIAATLECMENYCGNPGRGSHMLAMRSAEKVFLTRESLAELFGGSPENVIFTLNTTYALNMAIKGVMSGGGHLLISNLEHNSVLRPVARLAKEHKLTYSMFDGYGKNGDRSTEAILSSILGKLRRDTKMVVCVHTSNVCSHTLPIREIGKLCHRHGLLFCVDAAQSAGHLPIHMEEDHIDLLCMPAHKGLYAPQGCGILLLRDRLLLDTLIEGGNGIRSLDADMGLDSPERYEGGTLCTPAIAGLYAGLEFIKSIGIDSIARHEKELWLSSRSYLDGIRGVTVHDRTPGGVLLFSIDGIPADTVGSRLSDEGFCLRTGYHCTALAHQTLGTPEGGAVRIGFGIFNSAEQTERLCHAIERIAKEGSIPPR